MPETPAIRISGLTKTYRLYERDTDRIKEALHPLRKRFSKDFFALADVSLDIHKGEALGILGRNGSGKSTLLKIISGVLAPSAGDMTVNGTVSALLELGTGFNMELTGMENIYFSGTIQGREREVTAALIPDILAFADIGQYIHQPVKTYSSGMFARLAFAVAVAVDPDILIVDEALSVGDMRFQQKCIRKMQGFRDQGKTILYVTHDTVSVSTFCDKAMWLDHGRLRDFGEVKDVCKRYVAFMTYGEAAAPSPSLTPTQEVQAVPSTADAVLCWDEFHGCETFGEGGARIQRAALLLAGTSRPASSISPNQELRLVMEVNVERDISSIVFGFLLKNRLGQPIFFLNNRQLPAAEAVAVRPGTFTVSFQFRFPSLVHGRYTFTLAVAEGTQEQHAQLHWVHDGLSVEVIGGNTAHKSNCIMALPTESWSMCWETTPGPC